MRRQRGLKLLSNPWNRKLTREERLVLSEHHLRQVVARIQPYVEGGLIPKDWKEMRIDIVRSLNRIDELIKP